MKLNRKGAVAAVFAAALLAAGYMRLTAQVPNQQEVMRMYQEMKAKGMSDKEIAAEMGKIVQKQAADPNSELSKHVAENTAHAEKYNPTLNGRMNSGVMSTIQQSAMQGQLINVPMGVIPKAKPGKEIKLAVEFEPGTMLLPMPPKQAPASIQQSIKKVKGKAQDGNVAKYRYSVAGQVPVVSWKSGAAVQYLLVVKGTYENFKNILNGTLPPEQMQNVSIPEMTSVHQMAMHMAFDREAWEKRNAYIPEMCDRFNRSHPGAKESPPTIIGFEERQDYLVRYGLPSPFRVGDNLASMFSQKELTELENVYALYFKDGRATGVVEPGQTYTAIAVVLTKPIEPGDTDQSRLGGILVQMQENFNRKVDDPKTRTLDMNKLSTFYGKITDSMQPEKQAKYLQAYYTEFRSPE